MQRISLKIDVSKIDKDNLFKGGKGTYLDATLILNDQPDEYGNNGFIAQQFLKDNRKDASGEFVKTPILGNAKIWQSEGSSASSTPPQADPFALLDDDDDSGLPF